MNGFKIYKKFKKSKKHNAEDLYLFLLTNQNNTVDDIFLNTPTDNHNKEIYLPAQILFILKEKFFKKLFNKGIIKNDFDQSDIVGQKYEESISKRTKLRKERFDKIAKKEMTINLKLFKHYFNYQSPSKMYNAVSDTKNIEKHNIQVHLNKSDLINLKKDIGNASKNDVNKIEKMNKIADTAELILYFNNDDQQGQGQKILTPNQMLSRLPMLQLN